ncbi:premnaspirodiene oxygenase-like [Cynara cardunculus var. scolymus]|uniref:Cytochrome P450 n=1 Tax=Cynara cardunculus var. scolymus TaxID=59895 RepID=A0A118JXQ3_CYNCS|nr:premnaspirodiene oxygenase-like [Cynara cardunculus var. scolymus]KVH96761.1 cytochrome P450 [Cynara cardunculus var. scolymus]
MEFQSPFSVIIAFLVFLFFFLFQLVKVMKRSSKPKLPPGPWKLPFIGNMLSMISSELSQEILRNLARKYGPLMHLQLGEISAIVVSSTQVANEIFKNDVSFANRPEILLAKIVLYNSTDIGFAAYGDYWRQMRKICTLELLSTKKVQSFATIREQVARGVVDSIRESSGFPIDLTEIIFISTNTVTSTAAFGEKYKDQEELLRLLKEMGETASGFDVADLFPSYKILHVLTGMKPKLEKLHHKLDKILNDIINMHEENRAGLKSRIGDAGEEDLVDVMLRLKVSGDLEFPITSENIKAIILDVFAAGTDTSSSTVEWAMSEMVRNPQVMAKAQAEVREVLKGKEVVNETDFQRLNYLKLVIKETLRLHPPIPLLLPRECRERCEINGYMIPVKTKVFINAWALGRDPEFWIDAENFVPERFENSHLDFTGSSCEYIPFGAGRRICPGRTFGLANVEFLLVNLLYHFDWELPNGMEHGEVDMSVNIKTGGRKKNSLCLVPIPRLE